MLSPEKVTHTLKLLEEVYPDVPIKYVVDLIEGKSVGYFSLCTPDKIEIHLKFLQQLNKLWETDDVAVVYDDSDILIFPYESENVIH